ncbi:MAG: uracil-DNA glycosylase family protein, partial [Limisphaerales bacterium]
LGPRPAFQISPTARVLLVGQAPGRRVHQSGIPFTDPSGDRLRVWLGLDWDTFYDAERVAILPMGFCYPGTGPSGDLPPRPECAREWRARILAELRSIRVTILLGQYAIGWHLGRRAKSSLTETVRCWREYEALGWPLPHPSPRNNIWLRRNPWFETDVLPELRRRLAEGLNGTGSTDGSHAKRREAAA